MGVHVGPRVLGLAMLSEHSRCHFEQIADQAEHGVSGEMLLSEHTLTGVARISLSQHCMAVAGHHLRVKAITIKRDILEVGIL